MKRTNRLDHPTPSDVARGLGRVEYNRDGTPLTARSTLQEGRAWIREERKRREQRSVSSIRRQLDEEDRYALQAIRHLEFAERVRSLPWNAKDDLRHLAFHEAGHAVLAVLEGCTLKRVAVHVEGRRATGGVSSVIRRGSARYSLAGIEAAVLAGVDRSRAERWAASDLDHAARETNDMGRARREARELLRKHWVSVAKLAARLECDGEVSGAEAEGIVHGAAKA